MVRRSPVPAVAVACFLIGAARLVCPSAVLAQSIAEVQITPDTMTLTVGQRRTVLAAAFDRQGNLIPTTRFSFWSSDTAVANVRTDGTILAQRPGLAKIEARAQTRRAALALLVVASDSAGGDSAVATASAAPPVDSGSRAAVLAVDPPAATILPGETIRLSPRPLRGDGTPADPVRVTWRSFHPATATVDQSGLVTGAAAGTALIEARSAGGLGATAQINVAPAPFVLEPGRLVLGPDETDTLRAVVPAQADRVLRGGISWASSDPAIVQVTPDGVARGIAPGSAEITATGFGQQQQIGARVHRLPASFVVSPLTTERVIVPLRGTQAFRASAEAADSTPIPEARITWDVSDTGVAVFDTVTGVLSARTLGTTSLTARLTGFPAATWNVMVVPGTIGLSHTRVGLRVGGRDTLAASLLDQAGQPAEPAPDLTWTSSNTQAALVGNDGVVVATGIGHSTITATAPWGQHASAEVFVAGDLLFSSNRLGSFNLYAVRLSAPSTFLPVLRDSATDLQGVYSPDRTEVVFSSDRIGTYALYLMNADGSELRRLTLGNGGDTDPVWTPDGKQIVFSSTRTGVSRVYIMGADGENPRALTDSADASLSPAVSPDGKQVAFVSARDGNYEVYLVGLDGTGQQRVTTTPTPESQPHFFPNGDLAWVVTSNRGSGSQMVRHTAAGQTTVLAETPDPVVSFALSRDGRTMVYVTGKLTDVAKGTTVYRFLVQSTTPGSTPTAVPLSPGERIVSPAF